MARRPKAWDARKRAKRGKSSITPYTWVPEYREQRLPFLELIREAKAEDAKAAQSAHVADGSVIRTTVVKAETPLITFRVLFRIGSVHDPSDKPVLLHAASNVSHQVLAFMSHSRLQLDTCCGFCLCGASRVWLR